MGRIYLYAILANPRRRRLPPIGVPDGRTAVVTVPVGGVSAVVGEYRGPDFTTLGKPELLRLLAVHQKVVESAMVDQPLLPAKFGTLLATREELHAVLTGEWPRLLAAFDRLGDSVEIEVAATWDLGHTFAEIGREPAIANLVERVAGRPAEETLSTHVQVGELVKEALDRRRRSCRQRVLNQLGLVAVDVQPNLLLSDEMVLNVAFLVGRDQLESFFAEVHRLDEVFEGKLTFRCIGPLPPYSFATVEIARANRAALDAARQLLGLGEEVSEPEVHASFRRLAALWHPDHNPDDPSARQRFADLTAANRQLLSFLRSRRIRDGLPVGDRGCNISHASTETPVLAIKQCNAELGESCVTEFSHERSAVVA